MCYSLVSNQPECSYAENGCLIFGVHILDSSFNAYRLLNQKFVMLAKMLSELSNSSFSLNCLNYYSSYYFLYRFVGLKF